MKLGIIADIHGNNVALRAVLNDAEHRRPPDVTSVPTVARRAGHSVDVLVHGCRRGHGSAARRDGYRAAIHYLPLPIR